MKALLPALLYCAAVVGITGIVTAEPPADFPAEHYYQVQQKTTTTLAWDPNPPEDNVIGYRIYRADVSGDYVRKVDGGEPWLEVGNVTIAKAEIPAGRHYFTLTAFNAIGESLLSNEILVDISTAPGKPASFGVKLSEDG